MMIKKTNPFADLNRLERALWMTSLAAIAGSIAEAFYGVPDELKVKAEKILDEELLDIVCEFEKKFRKA